MPRGRQLDPARRACPTSDRASARRRRRWNVSACGLKPSLSVWKPLRGWRVQSPFCMPRGRQLDPARRACPTSDRASARRRRRWNVSACGLKPSLSVWKPLRGWRVQSPFCMPRGRQLDPARRACPTSDRASARRRRRWNVSACGLKPSLSAWKPLRGWRVQSPFCMPRGRQLDPARRACPTSDRASARRRRRWNVSACGLKPSLSVWKPLRGWRVQSPFCMPRGRQLDPARRACPTSDRASARRRRRWNVSACGLKPSLSVWKPLRGWRVQSPFCMPRGRQLDPARRACPTSDRASARRRRRWNVPEIQSRVQRI
jgi:hypothetical protein